MSLSAVTAALGIFIADRWNLKQGENRPELGMLKAVTDFAKCEFEPVSKLNVNKE